MTTLPGTSELDLTALLSDPAELRAYPEAAGQPPTASPVARGEFEVLSALRSYLAAATTSVTWSRASADVHRWAGVGVVLASPARVVVECSYRDAAAFQLQPPALADAEVRVRFTEEPTAETLIIDDRLACLVRDVAGQPELYAVEEPILVRQSAALFAANWRASVGLGEAALLSAMLCSAVKRDIVRLLVGGAKDESIARVVGLSLRTCRRHIAEILIALSATSRFQAGFVLGGVASRFDDLQVACAGSAGAS